MSLASFATNLLGPTPTLTVRPSSVLVAVRMARAMAGPSPCRSRLPVTSTKASSTLSASTSGEKRPRMSMKRWLSSEYRSKRGGATMACGQSESARDMGMALRQPNVRAS